MKNLMVVALFLVFGLCSCGTDHSKQNTTESAKTSVPEKAEIKTDTLNTAVFVCPMDPEITGKEGDKCSKCGMALVLKK